MLPLPWHKTAPVSLHDEAACGATDDLETCVFRREKRAFMRDASGFFPAMIGKKSRSADSRVIGDRSCKRSRRCRADRSRDMRSASAHARAARIDTFNSAAHARGMSIACDGFPCAWAATIAHGGGESDRDECRRPGTMRVHASALRDAHRARGADATRVARWIPIGAAPNQAERSLQIRIAKSPKRVSAIRRRGAFVRSMRIFRPSRQRLAGDVPSRRPARERPCMVPLRDDPRRALARERACVLGMRPRSHPRSYRLRALGIVRRVSRTSPPHRRRFAKIARPCCLGGSDRCGTACAADRRVADSDTGIGGGRTHSPERQARPTGYKTDVAQRDDAQANEHADERGDERADRHRRSRCRGVTRCRASRAGSAAGAGSGPDGGPRRYGSSASPRAPS